MVSQVDIFSAPLALEVFEDEGIVEDIFSSVQYLLEINIYP